MTDLRVACIHGRYESHQLHAPGWPEPESCPGGRQVTIDYEAAEQALRAWMKDKASTDYKRQDAARLIVAAAIGDTG